MAAISGVLRLDGAPVAAGRARRLAQRMAHRSPHGIATWDGGAIALAFGALHAGPHASRDVQPLRLEDGAVLVVDGRIDDRSGLARALGLSPGALDALGDAQLFGLSWLRWREELWRQVHGDYALAVWEPARSRLTLLRDRIGVRPLYWARSTTTFGFASEPEALLGIDGIPSEPNPDRVASNLVPLFDDGDRGATLYRDVRRVMPGTLLEVDSGGRLGERRYWSFGPLEPLRLASHDAYVEAFRETFDEAVRVRLSAAATPALMLSGGIDSAAVHASALQQGLALRRVSVIADQASATGERANIEALMAQSPDALRLILPGLERLVDVDAFAREVFEHAHPVRNSILLPLLVVQAAASAGHRVLLDGIDGDLVASTPANYVGRMALEGQPVAAWREARAAARFHTYLKHRSAPRIFAWSVASRLEPQWLARWRYRAGDKRRGMAPLLGLLHPERAASLRLRERVLERRLGLREDPALREWAGYRHWLWGNPGFSRGMEGFDLAASRFGMEARHPWCDHRVVAFFQSVPMSVVVRGGWTKHVARAAYAPELGAVAWHSGKQHLGPQVTRFALLAGREHVRQALHDPSGGLADWIDPEALELLRRQPGVEESDLSRNDVLLQVATLGRWFSRLNGIVDGETAKPLTSFAPSFTS